MADESQFILLLKSLFDNKGTKEASAALKEVKKEADATEKSTSESASKTSKSYQEMGISASLALRAAETMVKLGSAGITALYLQANNYSKQMGMGESTSRQWLKTTYQIKEATIGLGRTAAEAMLPAYQKTAEILTNISDWSNKNPAAAKTMFTASAALVTTGTMIATVNGLKNIFSGLGGLTKLFGGTSIFSGLGKAAASGAGSTIGTTTAAEAAGTAGTAGAAATVGGTIASVLAGIFAGLGINDLLAKSKYAQGPTIKGWGETGSVPTNQVLTVLVYELGQLVEKMGGKSGTALSWAGSTASATGAITAPEKKENEYVPVNMLQSMLSYQRTSKYAQEDYYRSLYTTQRDYQIQMQYAYEDYQIQVSRSQRDFQLQQAYSAQQFYYQQAIAQRNYLIQVARNEYDYQVSRKRAAEDHNWNLKQIMLSGDALQYYYSQRQYDIDKRRAEEDYELQKKRNAQDFALQQSDAATQFAMQRAYSQQQFQIQMADAAANFALQRKRQQEQYQIQLEDMAYQYELEKKRRWEAFQQEILPELGDEAAQRLWIEKQLETSMVTQFNTLMSQMVKDWKGYSAQQGAADDAALLSGNGSAYVQKYYANGGYTAKGIAMLHDNEFVMNAKTTAAAESAAKGALTQQKLISMFSGNGMNFTYEDNRSFNRGLSAEEKVSIRNDTQKILLDALSSY